MRPFYITIILCFLSVNCVFSQTFFDYVVKKEWEGEGTLMGNPAIFKMSWGKALDNQFYRLEFLNQFTVKENEITFLATGFYKINSDSKIVGTWFDSQGNMYVLDGHITKNKLSVNWGTPEKKVGKTIYTIRDDGTIKVTDYGMKDGEEIKFGEAIYSEKKN